MDQPQFVPDADETARRLAAQALAIEYFARIDRGETDAAASLYAEDATFLGAHGRPEIRQTMERGLAANAGRRTRHVVANLRVGRGDRGDLLVEFTALAYTLDGDSPLAPRTILDQEMDVRDDTAGALSIVEHRIPGFSV